MRLKQKHTTPGRQTLDIDLLPTHGIVEIMMLPERFREVGKVAAGVVGWLAMLGGPVMFVDGLVSTSIEVMRQPREADFPTGSNTDPGYVHAQEESSRRVGAGLNLMLEGPLLVGVGYALRAWSQDESATPPAPPAANQKAAEWPPVSMT